MSKETKRLSYRETLILTQDTKLDNPLQVEALEVQVEASSIAWKKAIIEAEEKLNNSKKNLACYRAQAPISPKTVASAQNAVNDDEFSLSYYQEEYSILFPAK